MSRVIKQRWNEGIAHDVRIIIILQLARISGLDSADS